VPVVLNGISAIKQSPLNYRVTQKKEPMKVLLNPTEIQ